MISLNNDDICLQDGGFSAFRRDNVPDYVSNGDNPYITGYSAGEQRRFLERELARARRSDEIDWIIAELESPVYTRRDQFVMRKRRGENQQSRDRSAGAATTR